MRVGIFVVVALVVACGRKAESAPVTEALPAMAPAAAATLFADRCAACHGPAGLGDGPAAAALQPRPRSLADKAWQASVTDAHIASAIIGGGAAVGLSPLMPPQGDLAAQPEVVAALVRHVRTLAAP